MAPDATHTGGATRAFPIAQLRVSSDRIARAGVLALVFVLAGLAASGVESLRARRAARWSATADLLVPEEWFKIAHGAIGGAPLEPTAIADEVVSGLRPVRPVGSPIAPVQAPADDPSSPAPIGPQREAIRRALHVAVDRPAEGMLRIGISLSSLDQASAVRQVNDLATAYAAELRLGLAREVLRRAAEVRTTEERVDGELRQIKPQLDAIIDRAVSKTTYLQSGSKETAERTEDKDPTSGSPFIEESTAASQPSAPVADRASLQRQVEELQRQRDRLLVNVTASHPKVRQIDAQIREAEQHLATMPPMAMAKPPEPPREIAKPEANAASPAQESPSPRVAPSQTAPQSAELFRAIQVLQERMESIARELRLARGVSIPGAKSLVRGDNLGVRLADQAEMMPARVVWQALALVAMAAGLVATAGVGMIWAGMVIDQPLETVHDVQRGLAIPVIGAIVVDQPQPESAASQVARARWKWPCIVGGMAVLGAYFAFLVQPFLAR